MRQALWQCCRNPVFLVTWVENGVENKARRDVLPRSVQNDFVEDMPKKVCS